MKKRGGPPASLLAAIGPDLLAAGEACVAAGAPRFWLHFPTTAGRGPSVHVLGCPHRSGRHTRVLALAGRTLEEAMHDPQVLDLEEREYEVRVSPCVKVAPGGGERERQTPAGIGDASTGPPGAKPDPT